MEHSPEVWRRTVDFFQEQLGNLDQHKSQSVAEEIWIGKEKTRLREDFRTFAQEFKVAQANEFRAKIMGMTLEEANLLCPSRFRVIACTVDGVWQKPEYYPPGLRSVVTVSVVNGKIAQQHGFE